MFIDFFPDEKEAAMANIITFSGFSGCLSFFFSFSLLCEEKTKYCVEYSDGTLHDTLTFEMIIVVTSILAAIGVLAAYSIHETETEQRIRREN